MIRQAKKQLYNDLFNELKTFENEIPSVPIFVTEHCIFYVSKLTGHYVPLQKVHFFQGYVRKRKPSVKIYENDNNGHLHGAMGYYWVNTENRKLCFSRSKLIDEIEDYCYTAIIK